MRGGTPRDWAAASRAAWISEGAVAGARPLAALEAAEGAVGSSFFTAGGGAPLGTAARLAPAEAAWLVSPAAAGEELKAGGAGEPRLSSAAAEACRGIGGPVTCCEGGGAGVAVGPARARLAPAAPACISAGVASGAVRFAPAAAPGMAPGMAEYAPGCVPGAAEGPAPTAP